MEDMGLALQNHQLEGDNERLRQELAALQADNQQLEARCLEAWELIRRLYGAFRWEANWEPQVQACKDAEGYLDLPEKDRRAWD